METTTARQHMSRPITEAWNAVKGLDYSDKLELATMLINSVKTTKKADNEEYSLRPFTVEELNARIDQAEAEIAEGLGIDDEDVWRELDEEFAREDAEDDARREPASQASQTE